MLYSGDLGRGGCLGGSGQNVREQPLVSVVTPSYNMAIFLPDAIESVLSQDYLAIEYIVMDGGSQDGTLAILERYKDRLRYVSQPDRGATDAVNRGFRLTRGEIFAWLSADDLYYPGAVRAAVAYLLAHPEAGAVYGEACWIDAVGNYLGPYPTRPCDALRLEQECQICQPACFVRREVFESAGMLDTSLHFAFDYDLWIRIARRHRFGYIPDRLAASRMHPQNKTLVQRPKALRESMEVLRRHYSYIPPSWVYTYCRHLLDPRAQCLQPVRPSALAYCLSLPVGWLRNPRRLWRYWREWAAPLIERLRHRNAA